MKKDDFVRKLDDAGDAIAHAGIADRLKALRMAGDHGDRGAQFMGGPVHKGALLGPGGGQAGLRGRRWEAGARVGIIAFRPTCAGTPARR